MRRDGKNKKIIALLKEYMNEDRDYKKIELDKYLNSRLESPVSKNYVQVILARSIEKGENFINTGRGLYRNIDFPPKKEDNDILVDYKTSIEKDGDTQDIFIECNNIGQIKDGVSHMLFELEQYERCLAYMYQAIDLWNASESERGNVSLLRGGTDSAKKALIQLKDALEKI